MRSGQGMPTANWKLSVMPNRIIEDDKRGCYLCGFVIRDFGFDFAK